MTSATVNLTEILTDEQYESVLGISYVQAYQDDLIRAVKEAQGGEVFQGTGDTYFPSPAFLTADEVAIYAEEMNKQECDEPIETTMNEVWAATEEVPRDVVQAIWNAIN